MVYKFIINPFKKISFHINFNPQHIFFRKMSYQKQKFGIMDEAYFVPKSEILTWINDLLKLNISKIQALGAGSIYCQILDVIYPGKVSLNKVNWKAKNDYQFIANLRLLQNALDKIGIKHYIDVQKIARAKYQDNLQLIQWFKRYFDLNCGTKGQGYQAQQKRGGTVPDFSFAQKIVIPKSYNASGQVIHKNKMSSPPKKIEQGVKVNRVKSPPTQKQKEPVQRVKSLAKEKKPQTAQTKTITQKKQQEKHPPINKNNLQKNITDQSNKKLLNEINALKKQSKQMKEKLEMIKQISLSKDPADMKLLLIQQVLHIQSVPQIEKKEKSSTLKSKEPQEQQSQLLNNKNQAFLQQGNQMSHEQNGQNIQFNTTNQNFDQNIQGSQQQGSNQPQFFQESSKPSMISEDDCI